MPDAAEVAEYPYLASLNAAQLKAPPDVPLQILAGPGSGKTRVLTCRVAHLVRRHKYKPKQITAVTFTNKAANEMRKRLKVLLGDREAGELVLGTFHATCARFLRRYGGRIALDKNFAIADADDCKKIMTRLMKDSSEDVKALRIQVKERDVLSDISKAKAKGESPGKMMARAAKEEASTSVLVVVAELYAEYEEALREANALDFDDLLLYGLKLFRHHPEVLQTCHHILVDEFQDTNTTQYELMRCFAKAHGGVSIVGDPDQSIYGWRAAEIENLNRMTKDFDNVQAIYLEENYRSTGAILAASHAIVSQDKARIQKNLFTSHPQSTPVTLKLFADPGVEAAFVATEIKRLMAYTGAVLNYDDFAILLRYNALSRGIEAALQKEGIPSRVIGGHKFFERMEIKDLLAYLQLADNPNFTPAFMRVVNVPKRAIGDKSVADFVAAAKKANVPPMQLAESIIDGDRLPSGIKPALKKNIAPFVSIVRQLRRAALQGMPVDDLLRLVIEKTGYEEYLRVSQPDFDQRWENVQELINYGVIVAEERQAQHADALPDGYRPAVYGSTPHEGATSTSKSSLHPMFGRPGSSRGGSTSSTEEKLKPRVRVQNNVVELLDSDDEDFAIFEETSTVVEDGESGEGLTPLRHFLQTSMLSTDTEAADVDSDTPRVTISTVHAAKGLEWPVVFLPAVEQGTIPFYRCTEEHEIAEERRLLYVAMTRAQIFLTLTYSQCRMMGGDDHDRELSEFVALTVQKQPNLFAKTLPTVDAGIRRHVAAMLGRTVPSDDTANEFIMKHVRSAPVLSRWDEPGPRGKSNWMNRGAGSKSRGDAYWASDVDDYGLNAPPANSGFTSAWSVTRPPTVPKPPPQRLQSSNRHIPAPLPFSFEPAPGPPPEQPTLTSFASTHLSSLNAMRNLGLPPDAPITDVASMPSARDRVPSVVSPFAPPSTVNSRSSNNARNSAAPGAPVILARGTKRLGMGRPAPWGSSSASDSKRPKS